MKACALVIRSRYTCTCSSAVFSVFKLWSLSTFVDFISSFVLKRLQLVVLTESYLSLFRNLLFFSSVFVFTVENKNNGVKSDFMRVYHSFIVSLKHIEINEND